MQKAHLVVRLCLLLPQTHQLSHKNILVPSQRLYLIRDAAEMPHLHVVTPNDAEIASYLDPLGEITWGYLHV